MTQEGEAYIAIIFKFRTETSFNMYISVLNDKLRNWHFTTDCYVCLERLHSTWKCSLITRNVRKVRNARRLCHWYHFTLGNTWKYLHWYCKDVLFLATHFIPLVLFGQCQPRPAPNTRTMNYFQYLELVMTRCNIAVL